DYVRTVASGDPLTTIASRHNAGESGNSQNQSIGKAQEIIPGSQLQRGELHDEFHAIADDSNPAAFDSFGDAFEFHFIDASIDSDFRLVRICSIHSHQAVAVGLCRCIDSI